MVTYRTNVSVKQDKVCKVTFLLLLFSHSVLLFSTPWTIACQAPLSVRFPRQEYWSGLLFPTLGNLSDSRDRTHISCIADGFFTSEPSEMPQGLIKSNHLINAIYCFIIIVTQKNSVYSFWLPVTDIVRIFLQWLLI